MAKATLLVLQGVDQGKRATIGQQTVSLGRGPQNTIRILDTEVSRNHAEILFENEHWTLHDLDSSNGSFVNGQSIRSHMLKTGDQLQIGRTILLFTEMASPGSSEIASRIDLLSADDPDKSQIVGTVASSEGKPLARQASVSRIAPVITADDNLQTLYRISEEAVRATDSLDLLLHRMLDLTIDAVGADRACMLVAESRSDRILPRVFSHRPGVNPNERMPVSTSIVNYVIAQGEGVWTSDALHDSRFDPGHSIVQAGIREAMCVPMQGRYELMGVIYVDITSPADYLLKGGAPRTFREELLTLLLAIGRQSALAVENFRYQEALVTAERLAAVGQTIASLSHDIKNILQGVRGGSYLIDMGLNEGKEELIRKGWTIVERNQDRIYGLVMDMLTYSKERQPTLKESDLNSVVEEVNRLIEGRIADHPTRTELHLEENLPTTLFDPEGILRAVLNVATNAIDAVEESDNGKVIISTDYDAETELLSVTVKDNGTGIPVAERNHIFDLFKSTKGARGTGLGLTVSQKIMHEHGGEIQVTCPEGGGCIFRLAWPRITDDAAPLEHTGAPTRNESSAPG
ncbi:MAG: FHA domain-containing protein [Planctomycetaceae bacterium]|nr:FHA domain-containing protein [Planctomycetaceae bacterium]